MQHYAYSSFGKLLKITDGAGIDITTVPKLTPKFTFTNRELDSESGLMYYRARYFDSSVGRFIQEDPHPGNIYLPISVGNKHAYSSNNPLSFVDPSGNAFFAVLLVAAVIAGAVNATLNAALADGNFFENLKNDGLGNFAIGFGTTFITGGIGYGVGSLAASYGASAAFSQVAGGVIAGAVGGGLGARLNPGNQGLGFLLGFVGGFASGFLGAGAGFNSVRGTNVVPTSAAPVPETEISQTPVGAEALGRANVGIGMSCPLGMTFQLGSGCVFITN